MAYHRNGEATFLEGLGCGPGCNCAPCRRSRLSGFGERYVRDEDFFHPEEPYPLSPGPPADYQTPPTPGSLTPTAPQGPFPAEAKVPPAGPRGVTVTPSAAAQLGDYGWTVRFLGAPPSHEEITRRAIGPAMRVDFRVGAVPRSVTLTSRDVDEIIEGNRNVDLGWKGTGVLFAFAKSEQKRHALRREYGQKQPDAWRDIVAYVRSEHGKVLAERDHTKRLRRIGQLLHTVQDSFSPAHTCRRPPSSWCIAYVRNFGRGGFSSSGIEHKVPKDQRDEMAHSTAAAAQAQAASLEYLRIVFKAIYSLATHPDSTTARREAAAEFGKFVDRRFKSCVEQEGHRYCTPSSAPARGVRPLRSPEAPRPAERPTFVAMQQGRPRGMPPASGRRVRGASSRLGQATPVLRVTGNMRWE